MEFEEKGKKQMQLIAIVEFLCDPDYELLIHSRKAIERREALHIAGHEARGGSVVEYY